MIFVAFEATFGSTLPFEAIYPEEVVYNFLDFALLEDKQ